jgi:P4 family phage/plasmid primase-like protien
MNPTDPYPDFPQRFKDIRIWGLWGIEGDVDKNGEPISPKAPRMPNGKLASHSEPNTWHSFNECITALDSNPKFKGLGIFNNGEFTTTDFDNCIDPTTKEIIDPRIATLVWQLDSYTEFSQSMLGLHVYNWGVVSEGRKKNGVEMYSERRFMIVTGTPFTASPRPDINQNPAVPLRVWQDIFGNNDAASAIESNNAGQSTDHERHNPDALTDADKILIKVASEKNQKFKGLFGTDSLTVNEVRGGVVTPKTYDSPSDADAAMFCLLAFWTNRNPERMKRLASASARLRGKWDTTRGDETWLERDIQRAIRHTPEGYGDADVVQYLDDPGTKKAKIAHHLVSDDLLRDTHFLTFADTESLCVYRDGIYKRNGDVWLKAEIKRRLKHRATKFIQNEVINAIKCCSYVEREDTIAPLKLLPMRNGVLDIETDTITPWNKHDPSIPFFYKYEGAYRPKLLEGFDDSAVGKFLQDIFPAYDDGGSDLPVVQEGAGSDFYNKYLAKKAFLYVGSGDNGKSLFITLKNAAVGKLATSSISIDALNTQRFAAAGLAYKTCNTQADASGVGSSIRSTGTVKTLTGNDLFTVEEKNKTPFQMVNRATLHQACNDLPKVEVEDPVFYDRFILLEMPMRFTNEPDPDDPHEKLDDTKLEDTLLTQDSIDTYTTWAVEGLKRLLKNGYYTETESTKNVMQRWIHKTDSLATFVDTMVEQSIGNYIMKYEFVNAYKAWCEEHDTVAEDIKIIGARLPTLVSTSTYRPHEGERAWIDVAVRGCEPHSAKVAVEMKVGRATKGHREFGKTVNEDQTKL